MPLGVPLSTLRRLLRAEIGASLNPQQGIAAQQSLDLILDRQQVELWEAYTWKHLRIYRDVPLAAGQFIYSYPEGIPFEQVLTVWFADSASAKWRPLDYGISLGMIPASGPMSGTPCRWDNVEAGGGGDDADDDDGVPPPGNTAPTITSDGGGPTANVTVLSTSTFVTTVTAFDPDAGQTLSYSIIGGTNASLFTIDPSTGVLSFKGPGPNLGPNLKAAVGTYNVIVQVSDGHGGFDTQDITVTVSDAAGNRAPTITSNGGGSTASVHIPETGTSNPVVTTVTATDPDAGQTLSYSIIGGTEAGQFAIGASSGVLSFVGTPTLGVYNVTVRVSDGQGGTDSQSITVTVGDVQPGRRMVVPSRAVAVPLSVLPTNPIGQFQLLPTPSSSSMLLRIEGQAAINPLVADTDKCVLDSKLITLFAAAEILASQKGEGAAMKLTKAQNHLRQLRRNQGADKRVNFNMGGAQRFGNDPDKRRLVPYIDYIPSMR
jgi:hypothetical protein